jgi:cytochrome d ubiquinol oxidase subunit I
MLDTLTAARAQMELSLGFHMVFAALGIAMPLFMCIAEGMWLRTRAPHYLELARRWGKATSLLFAIGAVSGTALSFELGLLWPRFMELAGSVIGPAFALEGYAFFLEAIFIGLYLYGWERLSPRAHFLCGVAVAVSGVCSGVLVIAANAWMQRPTGFAMKDGRAEPLDALATFGTSTFRVMAMHNTIACLAASAFALAGVYAAALLRGRRDAYHRAGLRIAMAIGAATAVLQLVTGDVSAREVAETQPAKLAAMEAHFETRSAVPLVVGGLVDQDARRVVGGIEIPYGLSLLVAHAPRAVVPGLDRVPEDEWPRVALVHAAFDVMVVAGSLLIALGALFWLAEWRKRAWPFVWRALLVGSPLGFVALEAGWIVAEAGRQPWIVHGVLRTRDGVTPASHVPATFLTFSVIYIFLAVVLVLALRRMGHAPRTPPTHAADEAPHAA